GPSWLTTRSLADSGISIEAPVFAAIARRISPRVEFFATTLSLPSAKITVGAVAGRCSGVNGRTSFDRTGVLGAVTCTPSPVTHAMADPGAGVSPAAAHELP